MSTKKLQNSVLVMLVLFSCHVNATTYQVPPPSSAKKNNATANIAEGINTIRKRGLTREAGQLQKLFNNGRIFYRTSGQHKHDAQYIHSFPPDDKKDTLYFAVQHVKYIDGIGTQRYDNSNYRYKYLMILVGLHEMVHKDQGRLSIASSVKRSNARGYALHEIEAYRTAFKKYANLWVLKDGYAFLQKYGDNPAGNYQALHLLRDKLFPLRYGIQAPIKYGDNACRWNALKKELDAYDNKLIAVYLDAKSIASCKPNLTGNLHDIQATVALRGKCRRYNKELHNLREKIKAQTKSNATSGKKLDYIRKKLKTISDKKLRSKFASDYSTIKSVHERGIRTLAELKLQYSKLNSENTKTKAAYKRFMDNAKRNPKNYDQCRLDFINKRIKDYKLSADQLPPDMVINKQGKAAFTNKRQKRKLELKESLDRIGKLMSYPTPLLSMTQAMVVKNPRTACPPKIQKTKLPANKVTGTKQAKPTPESEKVDARPAASAENILFKPKRVTLYYSQSKTVTEEKKIPLKKKRCSGGGLTGSVNCDVTARMAGAGGNHKIQKSKTKKTFHARVTITFYPYARKSSDACSDEVNGKIAVTKIVSKIDSGMDQDKQARVKQEANKYIRALRRWSPALNSKQTTAMLKAGYWTISLQSINTSLKLLQGSPGKTRFNLR